ncbi:hypothetical protein GCM10007890_05530 [Methylobacterium tardum]|uniref:Uncharacterized protein n=1 Tax=Methylobacterium tardum TaxID=374432 RepID=A0AA37T871_9HYPH|nr:hypothetical protein GCM10007890_05530 [Methylobacterium tardum]
MVTRGLRVGCRSNCPASGVFRVRVHAFGSIESRGSDTLIRFGMWDYSGGRCADTGQQQGLVNLGGEEAPQ